MVARFTAGCAVAERCSGIVLCGDAEGQTQTTTDSRAKRQPVRKLRRQLPEEVPEDDDMVDILPLEEKRPVRVLKPSASFDSFVVWYPDIPACRDSPHSTLMACFGVLLGRAVRTM